MEEGRGGNRVGGARGGGELEGVIWNDGMGEGIRKREEKKKQRGSGCGGKLGRRRQGKLGQVEWTGRG